MTAVRFDQTANVAVWVAVGVMAANVMFGVAGLLAGWVDDALEVEFGVEE